MIKIMGRKVPKVNDAANLTPENILLGIYNNTLNYGILRRATLLAS